MKSRTMDSVLRELSRTPRCQGVPEPPLAELVGSTTEERGWFTYCPKSTGSPKRVEPPWQTLEMGDRRLNAIAAWYASHEEEEDSPFEEGELIIARDNHSRYGLPSAPVQEGVAPRDNAAEFHSTTEGVLILNNKGWTP